jgi:hypothetical protein
LHSLKSGDVSAAVKRMFQIDFFELTVDGPLIGQKMSIVKMNCIINCYMRIVSTLEIRKENYRKCSYNKKKYI